MEIEAGASQPEIALRRGLFAYSQGDYDRALGLLLPLSNALQDQRPGLKRETDIADLRRTLGALFFIADRKQQSQQEFELWLLMDENAELDPYSTAPKLLAFFAQIKSDFAAESREAARLHRERKRLFEAPRIYEKVLQPKLEFLCYLPFGIGQFQNGDVGMGVLFLGLEVALLALNISGYIYGQLLAEPDGRILSTATNRRRYNEALVMQYVGLGGFVTSWAVGAVHARLRFRPFVVQEEKGPIIADGPTLGMVLEATF